jgi:hypothetical protein
MPVPGARAHVLVLYRKSSAGDAALQATAGLASEADARLTVLTFARTERVSRRCCGVSSAYWNAVVCELADQDLRHAADIIGGAPRVEFAVTADSSQSSALAREAAERGCDLLVLPRARRLLSGRRLRRALRRHAGCPVLELPAAAGTQVAGAAAQSSLFAANSASRASETATTSH